MSYSREELEALANGGMVRGPRAGARTSRAVKDPVARKSTPPKGHAAPPGSGPAGETCGGCAHYVSHRGGVRTHPKCGKNRDAWTRGPGSDIRKSDPACSLFTAKPVASKADYVRRESAKGAGGHHCHWPGCDKPVPPAKWSCYPHYLILKAERPDLMRRLWNAFRPGQEVSKTPSREYVEVIRDINAWIATRAVTA